MIKRNYQTNQVLVEKKKHFKARRTTIGNTDYKVFQNSDVVVSPNFQNALLIGAISGNGKTAAVAISVITILSQLKRPLNSGKIYVEYYVNESEFTFFYWLCKALNIQNLENLSSGTLRSYAQNALKKKGVVLYDFSKEPGKNRKKRLTLSRAEFRISLTDIHLFSDYGNGDVCITSMPISSMFRLGASNNNLIFTSSLFVQIKKEKYVSESDFSQEERSRLIGTVMRYKRGISGDTFLLTEL